MWPTDAPSGAKNTRHSERETMAKVEIYTTMFCPYCSRAKALLDRKGVAYEEVSLDEEPGRRSEMMQRAHGGRTVPQIFINGEHIGGCDDMFALDRAGRLDAKLGPAA
jgi:glutaredoxin 3